MDNLDNDHSATCNFSILPILSQSLMASSMEPGLLTEGGSAMPVRALWPALDSPAPATRHGHSRHHEEIMTLEKVGSSYNYSKIRCRRA